MPNDELHNGLPPVLSLDNIASGAGVELFGEAINRMAANIGDPNTDPTQTRKITLTLTAKPYKDRSGFEINLKVENKLAGLRGVDGSAHIANVKGQFLAFTKDTRQTEMEYPLPDSPDGKSKTNFN